VFHRRYAGRLAWQKRAWLFLLLLAAAALAGWFLGRPQVVGLAFCAFLYPVRWEEPRALRAIDARSLAYRAWLEAGPDHPLAARLAEAARREIEALPLPRFPWPELLVGALALTLATFFLMGPASPPPATASGKPAVETERGVSPGEGAAPKEDSPAEGGNREAGGRTPKAPPISRATGAADAGKALAGEGVEREAPAGGAAAGPGEGGPVAGRASGDRPSGGDGAPVGGNRAPAESEGESSAPAWARGAAPTPSGAAGPGSGGAPPPPPAVAPRGRGLPSPWPEGRPPEAVVRRAESYLSEWPLTPEERRLVARYFGLSAP